VPDVEAVARSYFERLTNQHDLGFIPELFDPAIAFYDPAIVPGGETHGHDGLREFFTRFFRWFPDVHFTIEDIFASDDRAAIRFTWTGTHKYKIWDIEVTERHVSVPGIDIFQITDDKIAQVWVAFDRLVLIEQLGGVHAL
jgi:steroid delta-isomerase-like uncharacterized protein